MMEPKQEITLEQAMEYEFETSWLSYFPPIPILSDWVTNYICWRAIRRHTSYLASRNRAARKIAQQADAERRQDERAARRKTLEETRAKTRRTLAITRELNEAVLALQMSTLDAEVAKRSPWYAKQLEEKRLKNDQET